MFDPCDTLMKERKENAEAKRTALIGRPRLVQYAKTFGACPRSASPYRTREEQNRKLFPAEKALVKIAPFTIWGRTIIECLVRFTQL